MIYDRANSCVTHVTPDQLHWESLLDTRLIHLTGITPALSPSCRETTEAILARAKAAGVPISFDVNYRAKLWSQADAADWIKRNIHGVDLLLCGQGDAKRLFGIDGAPEGMVDALAELSGAKEGRRHARRRGRHRLGWHRLLSRAGPPRPRHRPHGRGRRTGDGRRSRLAGRRLRLGLRCGVTLAALALSQHGDDVITTLDELAELLATTHIVGTVQR